MKIISRLYLLTTLMFFCACKKFVSLSVPPDQLVSSEVFKNDATATSAVLGIYSEMMNNPNLFSSGQITLLTGLYSDELTFYSPSVRDEFFKNQITVANHGTLTSNFWQPAYKFIYAANLVLEGLKKSSGLSDLTRDQLEGEARFIRAFCYFYLTNLFGEVPLVLTSDYRENAVLPRTSTTQIYDQMTLDLEQAKSLLSGNFLSASNTVSVERARPTAWAAKALLSRVYLFQKNWQAAEAKASELIASSQFNLVSNLSNVFLKNNAEAIWQLQPVNTNANTWEGNSILPVTAVAAPTYLVTNSLANTFEAADNRKLSWVNTRSYQSQTLMYPFKYKVFGNNAPITEYYTILRLPEQYLIRAEARVMQGNLGGAKADLNVIRNRAGLAESMASDANTMLKDIKHERQVELFCEWGHRWFDLKRWGDASAVLGPIKGSTWQATDLLWPIPEDQIKLNQLLTQNPGY